MLQTEAAGQACMTCNAAHDAEVDLKRCQVKCLFLLDHVLEKYYICVCLETGNKNLIGLV